MENDRVGNEKLLVAKSDKKCKKTCRLLWYMSKDKESDKDTSGKVEVEWDFWKILDIFNSRLYHKVTSSSRKIYNLSSL